MTYIAINRATIQSESAAEFERIAAEWLRGERARLPNEELLSRQLVRADGGREYAVISVWASKEVHDRHEDGPAEREGLRLLAPHLAGRPEQFTGEVVLDVRS